MELLLSFSVVLNYSIDVWAELGFLEMQQIEEKDCEQTNLVSCLHDEGNAFNTFVGAPGFTQYVLMSNSECKQNFCLFTRKAPQGIFWRCQMKDVFFYLFRLKSCKTFSILDFFWCDIPTRVSVNSLSFRTEQVVIFSKLQALRKPLSDLEFVESSCQCRFFLPSNQSESSDRWNVQSPRCLCADSPSSRRHYERWQGGMWFSSLQSTQSLRILYIFFFSCDPNLRQFFFPSCRSALSSSGSATYYLQPETQLRQKVSQTEREQESLTERIRGENSRSWMNEGLKMTQKNCFPCSPWVILSEQLSAFSSRWLSHRNNKPRVRRLS